MKHFTIFILLAIFSSSLNAATAVVYDPVSNVRKTPNGKIICKVRRIEKINLSSSSNNGWYETDICGESGVIHRTQIVFMSGKDIGIVYDPVSNIREAPNGKILCKVKKISAMKVSAYDSEWFSTNFCGRRGVIHQSQIKLVSNEQPSSFSSNTYSKKQSSCSDRTAVCLALTWGPDVCGTGFNKYAEENLNSNVHDIIASPSCLVAISEYLDEDYSDTDLGLAMLTGLLDEGGKAGIKSESLLNNVLGGLSYLASHSVKFSLYNSCMNKCN